MSQKRRRNESEGGNTYLGFYGRDQLWYRGVQKDEPHSEDDMSTHFTYIEDPETGEELEIECEISGGFYKETWGYHGGTPAEVPEVVVTSDLPEGVSEEEIRERVIEELRDEMEHEEYYRDDYDEYVDDRYDDSDYYRF